MASPQQTGIKFLANWIASQQLRGTELRDASTFERNLQETLDAKRKSKSLVTRIKAIWKDGDGLDFSSNDLLSLGSTGQIRTAFLGELASRPQFSLYAGGSRLLDGNYDYVEDTEQMIADFHGAEAGLIMNSGYNCNLAIYSSIPLADDVIVHDELAHKSTYDGIKLSAAKTSVAFLHNDVASLRETLQNIIDTHPKIRDGSNSVLISVESVYSVDGDICPLREMVKVSKEVCTAGNAVFIVDEAHATGIVGPKGAGLVKHLGMEKDVAIRLHTCGKALASSGGEHCFLPEASGLQSNVLLAIILGNMTVRTALLNYAHQVIYTTAMPFHAVAGMRAAYNLLSHGVLEWHQSQVQHLVKYFFQTITSKPIWPKANAMGILFIPVSEGWQDREFHAHILPVWTRQDYTWWLTFHLLLAHVSAQPVEYPSVPKGKSRIRVMFHAANKEEQVDYLADTLCNFAQEMIEIEESGENGRVPKAAQQVGALLQGSA
ncbi:MAG: hypothetical protein Q9162_004203 [Coniocarpon cinnabarinum]